MCPPEPSAAAQTMCIAAGWGPDFIEGNKADVVHRNWTAAGLLMTCLPKLSVLSQPYVQPCEAQGSSALAACLQQSQSSLCRATLLGMSTATTACYITRLAEDKGAAWSGVATSSRSTLPGICRHKLYADCKLLGVKQGPEQVEQASASIDEGARIIACCV